MYNIIDTLRKNNYTSCSPKQLAIIDEAYAIINSKPVDKDNETPKTEVISDDDINKSLASYSLSGGELFDDGDDE